MDQLSNRNDFFSVSNDAFDNATKNTYSQVNGKNTWILASICVALTVVTLTLLVQYFKVRKQITKLLRQNSISSGERMLNGTKVWDRRERFYTSVNVKCLVESCWECITSNTRWLRQRDHCFLFLYQAQCWRSVLNLSWVWDCNFLRWFIKIRPLILPFEIDVKP